MFRLADRPRLRPTRRAPALSAAVAVIMALILAACGGGEESQGGSAADLWDRSFLSTAVFEGGEPTELAGDTRIRLTFERRDDRDIARWRAGCNTYGGKVEVTDRISFGLIGGTLMGCPDELQDQDEWLRDFFAADPRWELVADRLTLTSQETVIELETNDG